MHECIVSVFDRFFLKVFCSVAEIFIEHVEEAKVRVFRITFEGSGEVVAKQFQQFQVEIVLCVFKQPLVVLVIVIVMEVIEVQADQVRKRFEKTISIESAPLCGRRQIGYRTIWVLQRKTTVV
jgi:hypothetical protein